MFSCFKTGKKAHAFLMTGMEREEVSEETDIMKG